MPDLLLFGLPELLMRRFSSSDIAENIKGMISTIPSIKQRRQHYTYM
jgi:hypothetical protein